MGCEPTSSARCSAACWPSGSFAASAARAGRRTTPTRDLLASLTDATGSSVPRQGLRRLPRTATAGAPDLRLFRLTEDARTLILQKAPTADPALRVEHGMITLRADAGQGLRGVTTVAEILRVTQEDT